MPVDAHERARRLLDRSFAEALAPEEQRWLDRHTSSCVECSSYAELSRRTVQALGGFAFEVDPAAALRVQETVRLRSMRLASAEASARRSRAGAAIAIALTVAGSTAMWRAAAWAGQSLGAPEAAWQSVFVALWLLPSLLIDAALLARSGGGGQSV
jgi:hypothetical protein